MNYNVTNAHKKHQLSLESMHPMVVLSHSKNANCIVLVTIACVQCVSTGICEGVYSLQIFIEIKLYDWMLTRNLKNGLQVPLGGPI